MVAVRCRVPGETCEIREACSRHLAIFTAKGYSPPHATVDGEILHQDPMKNQIFSISTG